MPDGDHMPLPRRGLWFLSRRGCKHLAVPAPAAVFVGALGFSLHRALGAPLPHKRHAGPRAIPFPERWRWRGAAGTPAPSPAATLWLPARSLRATQRKWQDSESPRGSPAAWAAGPQQDLCAALQEDEEDWRRGREGVGAANISGRWVMLGEGVHVHRKQGRLLGAHHSAKSQVPGLRQGLECPPDMIWLYYLFPEKVHYILPRTLPSPWCERLEFCGTSIQLSFPTIFPNTALRKYWEWVQWMDGRSNSFVQIPQHVRSWPSVLISQKGKRRPWDGNGWS